MQIIRYKFYGHWCSTQVGPRKIKIMPKKRYEIMSKYMPKVGEHGLDMMKRTTTIQANFDFSSTKDMQIKMRVAQSLQPCIIALYANSPFIDGN